MTLEETCRKVGSRRPIATTIVFWLLLAATVFLVQLHLHFGYVASSPFPPFAAFYEDAYLLPNLVPSNHPSNETFLVKHTTNIIDNAGSHVDRVPRDLKINCSAKKSVLIEYIEVAPMRKDYPKVLCFIMVDYKRHSTRVKAVRETWGKRCDKLVIASDRNDESMGAVEIRGARSDYWSLWQKLNQTVHYIWKEYHDEYEWFLKVDDDSYVIVENLKEFLASPLVQQANANNESLVYGRRINPLQKFGQWRNDTIWPWFNAIRNKDFGDRVISMFGADSTLIYNHGGAGYVMNRMFLSELIQALQSKHAVRGAVPEDMGIAMVMMLRGVFPQQSRDDRGRERFHPEDPDFMFRRPRSWYWNVHKNIGGLASKFKCCSSKSITFHHVQDLWILENQLYRCRQQLKGQGAL